MPLSVLDFRIILALQNELGSVLAFFIFWNYVKKQLFCFKFLVESVMKSRRPGVFFERFLFIESVVTRPLSRLIDNLYSFCCCFHPSRQRCINCIDHFKEPLLMLLIILQSLSISYFSDFGLISYCLPSYLSLICSYSDFLRWLLRSLFLHTALIWQISLCIALSAPCKFQWFVFIIIEAKAVF